MRFREFRATPLQTYEQNRTSNGTADVLYVLLKSLTALGLQALFFEARKIEVAHFDGANSAIEKWTQMFGRFFFVKTAADVRHLLSGSLISPQTCDNLFF